MQRPAGAPQPRNRRSWRAARGLPALVALAGCGDAGGLNLGSHDETVEIAASTCAITSNVLATTQAEIDALRGCRELPGDLVVRVPVDDPQSLSFAPLASLEVVRGQLWLDGPAASLVGFEALEQVGSLRLRSLRVPDLTSFRELRRAEGGQSLPAGRGPFLLQSAGLIDIDRCDELTDLRGLENLATWGSLSILGGARLQSLAGLQAPQQLERVELVEAPLLADVSALRPVRQMTSFTLWKTGLVRIAPLLLDRANEVVVSENPALTDLDGLGSLSFLQTLRVSENDALVRIELPDLEDFEAISIIGNAALEAVPFYDADSQAMQPPRSEFFTSTSLRSRRGLYEVGDNARVSRIALPTGSYDIEQVAIYANPGLLTLDMGNLQQSESIWIIDNSSLTSAVHGLRSVEELVIRNNPSLSVASFAGVQTFTRALTGNLDALSP